MQNSRRVFMKKVLIAGSVVTTSMAISSTKNQQGNGVVFGKSPKKEILFKRTPTWEKYYKAAH